MYPYLNGFINYLPPFYMPYKEVCTNFNVEVVLLINNLIYLL